MEYSNWTRDLRQNHQTINNTPTQIEENWVKRNAGLWFLGMILGMAGTAAFAGLYLIDNPLFKSDDFRAYPIDYTSNYNSTFNYG